MLGEPSGLSVFLLLQFRASRALPVGAIGTVTPGDAVGTGTLGEWFGRTGGASGGGFLVLAQFPVAVHIPDLRFLVVAHRVEVIGGFALLQPARGGKIGKEFGGGQAEALAVLQVEIFGVRPGRLGFVELLIGAEGVSVGADGDFGGRLLGGGFFLAFFGADGEGARERLGGDVAEIAEGAGFGGIEHAGEEAVGCLGEEELDGGVVLEEGEGDFGALLRALGVGVVLVGEAEVVAGEGGGVALHAVGSEGAAAAGFFGAGRDGSVGGFVRERHWDPFWSGLRAQSSAHRVQGAKHRAQSTGRRAQENGR